MSRAALIVGAGIGGLAAGVALQRAGWQVRIFERAATPRELGFALGLAPNALAALRELGLDGVMQSEGASMTAAEVQQQGGRVLKRFDVALGGPAVVALRPALHGALLTAVGDEALVLGREAVDFTVAGSVVTLSLADGSTAAGDVLVGADGMGSVIRRGLRPHEPPPRRSGHCGIRGVAYGVGHFLGDLSGAFYLGDGVEGATVRASQDAVYWYLSVLAADFPPGMRDPRAVHARLAPLFDDRFRAITGATGPDDIRFDDLFDRDPIDEWGRGPVTLLGDAAHPMLPHAGQGAAQALEDAVALGLVLAPEGDIPAALRRYERVRSARSRSFALLSRRISRVTTTHHPVVRWLRDTAIRLTPATLVAVGARFAGTGRDPHRALR